jgi:type IV pilus assembly protein PilN
MIRINLLGSNRTKKGKRAAVSVPTGEGANPMTLMIVIGLITLGLNGFYWWRLNAQHSALQKKLQVAQREQVRLRDVKAKFDERQKQKDAYQKRLDVINQLRTSQVKPVDLLHVVGDTVNATEAVWLNWVKDEGARIDIEGVALSINAVANLMENIKKTGYFKNVEMKESIQDDKVKEMQAFVFTLTCEKKIS